LHSAQINKPKNLIRAKFILSPKIDDNVANKILFLLSALVFKHLVDMCGNISTKILNARVLYHFFSKSYHQVINIQY
jgi:hypothetical protein